jgi:hypothetical protein
MEITVLKFWYKSQPKHIKNTVRDAIIKKCEIHQDTFYKWLNKKQAPKLAQKVIGDITGLEHEKLYENVNFKINRLI